jgi:hypothetical protein
MILRFAPFSRSFPRLTWKTPSIFPKMSPVYLVLFSLFERNLMRRFIPAVLALLCIGGIAVASNLAPKKTVKEVMKAGFAGNSSLCKKVTSGEASDEEKKQFLDLLIDLVENNAPKGDETEWKMQSGTALVAAAKVVTGREGALEELGAAVNCKACHDKFKGK